MKPIVTVIDYGMGNLFSVGRALEHCGAEVVYTDDPVQVINADRLVLPGVGAFADGMAELQKRGLVNAIKEYGASGRGFLGICLGMQMMLDASVEFGEHSGLGLIPGHVVPIPVTGLNGEPHKIPHIGWNRLIKPELGPDWHDSILATVPEGTSVYFVHSFTAVPADDKCRLADCLYNGRQILAAIRSGPLCGCQFHPEKSGEMGLRIIKNFLIR